MQALNATKVQCSTLIKIISIVFVDTSYILDIYVIPHIFHIQLRDQDNTIKRREGLDEWILLAQQIDRPQNNCGFIIPSVPLLLGKIIQPIKIYFCKTATSLVLKLFLFQSYLFYSASTHICFQNNNFFLQVKMDLLIS